MSLCLTPPSGRPLVPGTARPPSGTARALRAARSVHGPDTRIPSCRSKTS